MASHTFVRLGRYHDGVTSNVRAFEADMDDSEHCRQPYLPEHNLEMLIYAATSGGEVQAASCFAVTSTHSMPHYFCWVHECQLNHSVFMLCSLSEPLLCVVYAVTSLESTCLPGHNIRPLLKLDQSVVWRLYDTGATIPALCKGYPGKAR